MASFKDKYKDFDFETFINGPNAKTFLGDYYDYYRDLWSRDLEKSKGDLSRAMVRWHWNLLALVFLPAWLGYHKLFVLFYTFTALISCGFLIEAVFDVSIPTSAYGMPAIVFAFMSKSFYLSHVVDFFDKNGHENPITLKILIKRKGGTSVKHAVLFSVAYLFWIILCVVALEVTFGFPVAPDGSD